jgi:hypothetical protein
MCRWACCQQWSRLLAGCASAAQQPSHPLTPPHPSPPAHLVPSRSSAISCLHASTLLRSPTPTMARSRPAGKKSPPAGRAGARGAVVTTSRTCWVLGARFSQMGRGSPQLGAAAGLGRQLGCCGTAAARPPAPGPQGRLQPRLTLQVAGRPDLPHHRQAELVEAEAHHLHLRGGPGSAGGQGWSTGSRPGRVAAAAGRQLRPAPRCSPGPAAPRPGAAARAAGPPRLRSCPPCPRTSRWRCCERRRPMMIPLQVVTCWSRVYTRLERGSKV